VPFQISQRADFFEEEVGLETTLKRPIVNTRDEPHCDPNKYRRLHVIVGDANMSETATLVKLGATAIVLAMIEDDVSATISCSPTRWRRSARSATTRACSAPILLRDGRRMTAMEIQWGLLERARKYERRTASTPSARRSVREVLTPCGRQILAGLERDPESWPHQVDWVAKRRLVEAYADRHGLRPTMPG
jgi:hypothetical protein